jgi:hypothetical protein
VLAQLSASGNEAAVPRAETTEITEEKTAGEEALTRSTRMKRQSYCRDRG